MHVALDPRRFHERASKELLHRWMFATACLSYSDHAYHGCAPVMGTRFGALF